MVLEALTVRVGADLGPFNAGMSRVVATARATNQKIATGFASLQRNATRAATTIGTTLGVVSTLGLKAFETYETGLAEISTLTSATAEEMGRLGAEQRKLAVEFGADIGPQLKATYDGISAGVISVTDATEFMTVVNKAATAGLTDQATAAEAIIRIMRAYGDQVDGAGEAADYLFKIVERGVTTFGAFAPKIGNLAGVTASANVSLKEMGAVFATITGTANTEQSITQATALINGIIAPADGAKKVARDLSIGLDAVTLATQGVAGVMDQVRTKLGIVADEEFVKLINRTDDLSIAQNELGAKMGLQAEKLAELFPNVRALRAALALMANEGKTLTANLEANEDVVGGLDRAYVKMSDTLGVRFRKAVASLRDVAITIGELMAESFEGMLSGLRDILGGVSSWIERNRELAQVLGKIAIVTTAVAAALIPIGLVAGGVTAIFGALAAVGTIVGAVISGIGALALPVLIPLGLLAGAVALVVAGFVEAQGGIRPAWETVTGYVQSRGQQVVEWFRANWPTIKATAIEVFTSARDAVMPIARAFFEAVRDHGGRVLGWFRENWPQIRETFDVVAGWIRATWENVWKPTWEFIGAIVANTWKAITTAAEGAWKVLSGIMEVGMGVIRGDWVDVWEGMKRVAEGVWQIIEGLWEGMWSNLGLALDAGAALLGRAFSAAFDGFVSLVETQVNKIVTIFEFAWAQIGQIIGRISDGVGYIASAVGDLFGGGGGNGGQSFPLGGMVHGKGAQRATVHGGEFVVDAGTTATFGAEFFRGLQDVARGGNSAPVMGGGINVAAGAIVIQGGGGNAHAIADAVISELERRAAHGQLNRGRRGSR